MEKLNSPAQHRVHRLPQIRHCQTEMGDTRDPKGRGGGHECASDYEDGRGEGKLSEDEVWDDDGEEARLRVRTSASSRGTIGRVVFRAEIVMVPQMQCRPRSARDAHGPLHIPWGKQCTRA